MRSRRFLVLACGVLFFLLGAVAVGQVKAQTPTPTPQPPEPLSISGPFVEPVLLLLGEDTQTRVTLTLDGNDLACPPRVETGPVDMYLVIDRSSSMDDPAGGGFASKIDAAKAAARVFLQQVDFSLHRVGIVSFNTAANEIAPLLNDRAALEQALETIATNDGTAIDAGLVRAIRLLQMHGRSDARKIIILLSDGDSNPDSALQAAEQAAQEGIRIITVALGPDANRDLLQQVASDSSDFYYALSADDLQSIYQTIAHSVERPRAVSQVQVHLRYDPTSWEVVDTDPEIQPAEEGHLQWQFRYLPANHETLEIVLRPLKPGDLPALQEGVIGYVECEQTQRTVKIGAGPVLQISPPPTPTPRPTPTPPPPSLGSSGGIWSAWLCPQWPWWLVLLWALGWLWWLYRVFTCLREREEQCWWCNCLRTLYWPWFLLFVRFLAKPLQSIVCLDWPWSHWWQAIVSSLPLWLLIPLLIALAVYLCERFCPVEERVPPQKEEIREKPQPLPPVQMKLAWQVRPALIIGVGGTGRWVLTHLKQLLMESGQGKVPEGVRFFVIDTAERETVNRYRDRHEREQSVAFAGVTLEEDEVFLLQGDLQPLIQYLARLSSQGPVEKDLLFADWFPAWDYQTLGVQTNLTQGTFGRRPLARAGLIQHMQQEAPALWQRLLEQVQAVESQGEVRVYLVGSMGGGMSGVFADLGYLIRKATEVTLHRAGHLRIEALLATPGVYAQVSPTLRQQNINAWALARELTRFQKTGRYPYPIRFSSEDRPFNGAFEGRLFDMLYLFGGDGYRPQDGTSVDEPWASVLASMADFLYLHLDAVLGGKWYTWRDGLLARGSSRQVDDDDMVIATVGTFSLRYPFYTLWREARSRWMADMARRLISSLREERRTWEKHSPKMLASAFFEGRGDLQIGPAPQGLVVAYRRLQGESIGRREMEDAYQHPESPQPFRDYLYHLLLSILNGRLHGGEDAIAQRIGYVHFAARFLEEVALRLQQMIQRIGSDEKMASLEQVLQGWLDDVRNAQDALAPWLGAKEQEGLKHLVQEMEREAQYLHQSRQQMQQVTVRRYLWNLPPSEKQQRSQDLVEYWLHTYGDSRVQEYLDRFYWELDEHGRLHWKVILGEELVLTPDTLPQVLESMAQQAFREIFEEFTFGEMAAKHGWLANTESERRNLEWMWAVARPHLQVERHHDFLYNAVLALPEALRESALARLMQIPKDTLPGHLEPTAEAYVEAWSESAALTLVRFYDLVRLRHVPEAQDRWMAAYRRSLQGILEDVEPPTRAHVFRAEANAVRLEDDMARRLYLPDFAFGPFLTLACHDVQRLQAFVLAYAAGWVHIDGNEGRLVLPNGAYISRHLVLQDPLPSHLQMALRWVLARLSSEEDGFYHQLQSALQQPSEAIVQKWREVARSWTQGPPAHWSRLERQQQEWEALQAYFVRRHLEALYRQRS